MWVAGSLFIINHVGDEGSNHTDRQPATLDLTQVIVGAQNRPNIQ